jgi:RNase H-fold protein (predicted Holliday junction resolvase)
MMPVPDQKGAQSKRNRIVINIEGSGKGARRLGAGGGGFKALGVFGLVLLVLVLSLLAGLYFWWQSYKSGPAYSLALVVDAAQRNDTETLNQLVDTDQIVENFVKQLSDRSEGGLSAGLGDIVRRQAQTIAARALPQVKQRVRQEVAGQVKELSERAQGKPFILVALGMPWVVEITEENDKATAKTTVKDRPVELTMQRSGERWKIVALKDEQLTSRIIESVMKNLPAQQPQPPSSNVPDVRREIRKRLPPGVPDIPLLDEK